MPNAVMQPDAPVVNADMLLTDALALLDSQAVSGLAVCYADTGRLCGILTTTDILRVFRVVMQIGSLSDQSTADGETQDSGN